MITKMTTPTFLTLADLEAGLAHIRASPKDGGELQLIVRRPSTDCREILNEGMLDLSQGLAGDDWMRRRSRHTPDGAPDLETQLTIMNMRVIDLISAEKARWPMAGDQLYADLDLSATNLAPGTRLTIGEAEIEVTSRPHTGCAKFAARFGVDALKFVNTPEGRELRLRGLYAKVIRPGTIRCGERLVKMT